MSSRYGSPGNNPGNGSFETVGAAGLLILSLLVAFIPNHLKIFHALPIVFGLAIVIRTCFTADFIDGGVWRGTKSFDTRACTKLTIVWFSIWFTVHMITRLFMRVDWLTIIATGIAVVGVYMLLSNVWKSNIFGGSIFMVFASGLIMGCVFLVTIPDLFLIPCCGYRYWVWEIPVYGAVSGFIVGMFLCKVVRINQWP